MSLRCYGMACKGGTGGPRIEVHNGVAKGNLQKGKRPRAAWMELHVPPWANQLVLSIWNPFSGWPLFPDSFRLVSCRLLALLRPYCQCSLRGLTANLKRPLVCVSRP